MTPETALAGRVRIVPPPRGEKIGRLHLLSVPDAVAAPARAYLVKNLLAAGDLAVLYGEPGCGKSFLALHLAYALARGERFFGRRVVPAPVIYCGLEGEAGMAKRVRALAREHGDAPTFRYIGQPLPLADDAGLADDVVKAARTIGARLVVIDTLARAMAGLDENTASDMGKMVGTLDRIRDETGATIALVHHMGKDRARGMRGSNALLAAADLAIEVDASAEGTRTWRVVKAKDDPGGDAFAFTLRSVTLETDADGDVITTCLVEEGEAATGARRTALRPQQRTALAILHDTIAGPDGADLPNGSGFPTARLRGCRMEAWRRECDARGLSNADDPQTRARVFRDVRGKMKAAGVIAEREGWVWPTRSGNDP